MKVDTLIIGYVPLTETIGKKPRELRDDKYYKDLLAQFDLGTVNYASRNENEWKKKVDEINPVIIIYFGGEYYAKEVKDYKSDSMLYVAEDTGSIFYRKAEADEKKEKHKKIFTEIESIVKRFQIGEAKEIEAARKYSAMSYDEMYKMIQMAIIGEDKELSKKAWELLNDNKGHSNFVWMRVQMLVEVWQHCDGKGKEEFLCQAMDQHIENGIAYKMDDFTDEDGQKYHQYMFTDFDGYNLNYVRRIPYGEKKQDKYTYEAILKKYETANGVQVMLEAGQMRTKKAEHLKSEGEKIFQVLTKWKENPLLSKKELRVTPWNKEDSDEEPLTERELNSIKKYLKRCDESKFILLFP